MWMNSETLREQTLTFCYISLHYKGDAALMHDTEMHGQYRNSSIIFKLGTRLGVIGQVCTPAVSSQGNSSPSTHSVEGLVGPRAVQDTWRKQKNS